MNSSTIRKPWVNPYHVHPCDVCSAPSVGFSTNLIIMKYYCLKHYNEMSRRVDAWLSRHEPKEWRETEEYHEENRPKTLAESLRPKPKKNEITQLPLSFR